MLNKKMLLSVLIIGVVATVAGAGTWAQWSDTETSTANTFTAGTMDLQLSPDGTNFHQSISNVLSIGDVYPGAAGQMSGAITVKNVGTVPGKLTWATTTASNSENGLTEPEQNVNDEGEPGELSSYVTLSYAINGAFVNPSTGVILAPNEAATITANYVIGNAGNNIQSDIATYDITFTLTQNT